MIPLRDDLGRRGLTPIAWALPAIWVVAHLVITFGLDEREVARLHAKLALDPRAWWSALDVLLGRARGEPAEALWRVLVPLFGHRLLHSGVFHVLANAMTLPLFGGRLERRVGSWRFLAFHELAGLIAAFVQLAVVSGRPTAGVGASGAVAASIVAYLLLYPRARVLVVVPVLVLPLFFRLRAFVGAGAWLLLQFRPIARLLDLGSVVPLSWQALAAGAGAGIGLLPMVWRRRSRR